MVTEAVPAVEVEGLRKSYGAVQAVRGVDLDCPAGDLFGLIGPDGAGKSSLLKVIAGVMTFDEGRLRVLGERIDSDADAERIKPRLGFMPQGLGQNLYPDLSVEENVDFLARMRQVPESALAERKARLLGLTRLEAFRGRAMKQLSGGMKQKLGLVCTLIHEPDLVILDEPTTGVDPVSRRDFWEILTTLVGERGITAVVATAYMDEAARFHRAALMHEGVLIAVDDPEALLSLEPGRAVTVETDDQAEAMTRLRARFHQITPLGDAIRVFVPGKDDREAEQAVREALGEAAIRALSTDEPDLEDVFIARVAPDGDGRDATAGDAAGASRRRGDGPVIRAQGLIRDFGDFRAVDEVSFEVVPGEVFGLLGANGAGKTTVIKMLTGILPPSGGNGQVAGVDMRRPGRDIKRRIGYMSQAFSLYQDLTVLENLRLYGGIYGVPRRQLRDRLDWILALAGLHGRERDLADALPMGMRQRLALGCALVHRPPILFLDEPTSGVDPVGRRAFWDILFELSRREGVAMLVTTHYMVEAEHCDHLCLMHAGRVIADDTPEGLKREAEERFGHLLEIRCEAPYPAQQALRDAGYGNAHLYGRRVHLLVPDIRDGEKRAREVLERADIGVQGIRPLPLAMENVFVQQVLARERDQAQAA